MELDVQAAGGKVLEQGVLDDVGMYFNFRMPADVKITERPVVVNLSKRLPVQLLALGQAR